MFLPVLTALPCQLYNAYFVTNSKDCNSICTSELKILL